LAGYRSFLRKHWSWYDEGPTTHLGHERRVRPGRPLAIGDGTRWRHGAWQGRRETPWRANPSCQCSIRVDKGRHRPVGHCRPARQRGHVEVWRERWRQRWTLRCAVRQQQAESGGGLQRVVVGPTSAHSKGPLQPRSRFLEQPKIGPCLWGTVGDGKSTRASKNGIGPCLVACAGAALRPVTKVVVAV
jgi:hypothetical protein